MERKLLFSVTKDDCDWGTFTSGGAGGQHQNRIRSGVRCRHRASGAVGEARDTRSQLINKRAAFRRMVESKEFIAWHKIEVVRRRKNSTDMVEQVEAAVDASMDESNLKVEYF